ncbi:MAG: helix-turn-helix domain-containing protein [Phycisphaerae bacterium]
MAKRQRDAILTIDELAVYMKLSKSSLYHFARAGNVPGVKIGRHWRFQRSAVDEWMRSSVGSGPKGNAKRAPKRKKAAAP